ncbi:MAG: chromosomal replication initiator protein DnaA, partial [Alphaproteobacteria bacterium]|nr:chromosomal replication initiator protein DnaA [Alphaproteobacteria bacterium]
MDGTTTEQWARVRAALREEFGENAYRSWLKPLTFEGLDGDTVHLSVPTRFMRNWIESQYGERLTALWASERQSIRTVLVRQAKQRPATQDIPDEAAALPDTEITEAPEDVAAANLSAPIDPRFTFETLLVGP